MRERRMLASPEFLWRLNQEYVNRLARARTYLDLLEKLIYERSGESEEQILSALEFTRVHLNSLNEEHREWRYTFFYDSPETRRMVQSPREIRRAVTTFSQMQERHKVYFDDLVLLLEQLPRPETDMTSIPAGDLWELMQYAVNDLVDFSGNLNVTDTA
jgi:hypothetical protein